MKCEIMLYRYQNRKFAIIQSIAKIISKVCFERFESINLKHSIGELELDCFFRVRVQTILFFEFKFEFGKNDRVPASSSSSSQLWFEPPHLPKYDLGPGHAPSKNF